MTKPCSTFEASIPNSFSTISLMPICSNTSRYHLPWQKSSPPWDGHWVYIILNINHNMYLFTLVAYDSNISKGAQEMKLNFAFRFLKAGKRSEQMSCTALRNACMVTIFVAVEIRRHRRRHKRNQRRFFQPTLSEETSKEICEF